jgi:hypothetical protein
MLAPAPKLLKLIGILFLFNPGAAPPLPAGGPRGTGGAILGNGGPVAGKEPEGGSTGRVKGGGFGREEAGRAAIADCVGGSEGDGCVPEVLLSVLETTMAGGTGEGEGDALEDAAPSELAAEEPAAPLMFKRAKSGIASPFCRGCPVPGIAAETADAVATPAESFASFPASAISGPG